MRFGCWNRLVQRGGGIVAALCVVLVLAAGPARAGEGTIAGFAEFESMCPEGRKYCLTLVLYLAATESGPVQSPEWVRTQVAMANKLFGTIDVGFQVQTLVALAANEERIVTRTQRDLLGRKRFEKGAIHVFVVGYLANVDEEGEIFGVHWRDRERTSRRWIILSAIAWDFTLVHELGHFFGLKHCALKGSIMNKIGHDDTPMSKRGFAESEIKKMKRRLKRHLKSGMVKPL